MTSTAASREILDRALQSHRAGNLSDAEKLYQQVLSADPKNHAALNLLGTLASQTGRAEEGAELISRAISLSPQSPDYYQNLGFTLERLNRLEQAEAAYRKSLSIQPENPQTLSNLGNVLRLLGRASEAIEPCRRAVHLAPQFPEARNNLGVALQSLGQLDEAAAQFRQAIESRPNFAAALANLGSVLYQSGRLAEAITAMKQAVTLNPGEPSTYANLAPALAETGDCDLAFDCLRRALELRPRFASALNNLGNLHRDTGRIPEAIQCYQEAAAIEGGGEAASNLLYSLLFDPKWDSATILAAHKEWAARCARPADGLVHIPRREKSPARRLRVGYVSADFRAHVVGRNILPLFERHDREQIEVIAYSNVQRPDPTTEKLRSHCLAWRDIRPLTDRQAAETIAADGIDILVDLSLHLAGNRLLVFARKPAPVQVTFAGYPGTTGLSAIDYRLTDPNLDPPGMGDELYTEKSLRLPHSFWCYQPDAGEIVQSRNVQPLPAATNGYVTFGSLNSFSKVTPGVLELWAKLLAHDGRSRLLMNAPRGETRRRITKAMQACGIDPSRIEFVERQPHEEYLRTYQRIDIALDTFPYGGHTTTLDALWMGVPVVSVAGKTVVGRAGLSALSNIGLPELAAADLEGYVNIAARLAKDLTALANIRRTLRPRMEASPLMDAAGFARGVEAAYRKMWQTYCES